MQNGKLLYEINEFYEIYGDSKVGMKYVEFVEFVEYMNFIQFIKLNSSPNSKVFLNV